MNFLIKSSDPFPQFKQTEGLHVSHGAQVNIGKPDTQTSIIVATPAPVAVAIKNPGSQVILNSEKNVIVGNINYIPEGNLSSLFSFEVTGNNNKPIVTEEKWNQVSESFIAEGSNFKATFSGPEALWFGDEIKNNNAYIALTFNPEEINFEIKFGAVIDTGWGGDLNVPIVWSIRKATSGAFAFESVPQKETDNDNFNVTLENGGQWIYFGVPNSSKDTLAPTLEQVINPESQYYVSGKNISGKELLEKLKTEDKEKNVGKLDFTIRNIPKRLTSLTLNQDGIVNLSDNDAKAVAELYFGEKTKAWPQLLDVKHDYVRFGNLKSETGKGIFRLDINVDRAQSDMIFVEGSTTGGEHKIQIASFEGTTTQGVKLPSIKNEEERNLLTSEHKIRFATVAKNSGVTFTGDSTIVSSKTQEQIPVVNYYGNELHNIKFIIGSEAYDPNSAENAVYESRVDEDAEAIAKIENAKQETQLLSDDSQKASAADLLAFDPDTLFEGGTNYYLVLYEPEEKKDPVIPNQPSSPIAKAHFGLASWLFGTHLDRLHKRLGEAQYEDEDSGLWTRARYSQAGDHNLDLKWGALQLGVDFKANDTHRLGIAFEANSGQAKLDDVNGKNNLHGFNLLAYDTWLNDKGCYLDLTARWGKVHNAVWLKDPNRGRYDANYRQTMYALGAEAGKKFLLNEKDNIFLEPQIQFQWAHVSGANWKYHSNLKSGIKSANSFIGRVGARLGKEWKDDQDRPYSFYLHADLLREFGKPQKGYIANQYENKPMEWGGRSTWGDVGVFGQVGLSKSTRLHFNVEKEIGRGKAKTWQVNTSFRYWF